MLFIVLLAIAGTTVAVDDSVAVASGGIASVTSVAVVAVAAAFHLYQTTAELFS